MRLPIHPLNISEERNVWLWVCVSDLLQGRTLFWVQLFRLFDRRREGVLRFSPFKNTVASIMSHDAEVHLQMLFEVLFLLPSAIQQRFGVFVPSQPVLEASLCNVGTPHSVLKVSLRLLLPCPDSISLLLSVCILCCLPGPCPFESESKKGVPN